MRTETKNVYYCQHCKKNGLVKWMIEKHEKFCGSDPANFSKCCNCVHVIEISVEIDYGSRGNEDYIGTSTAFNCAVKNCGLIPLIARRKGLPEKYPETFKNSIPMPNECSDFQEIDFFNM